MFDGTSLLTNLVLGPAGIVYVSFEKWMGDSSGERVDRLLKLLERRVLLQSDLVRKSERMFEQVRGER